MFDIQKRSIFTTTDMLLYNIMKRLDAMAEAAGEREKVAREHEQAARGAETPTGAAAGKRTFTGRKTTEGGAKG